MHPSCLTTGPRALQVSSAWLQSKRHVTLPACSWAREAVCASKSISSTSKQHSKVLSELGFSCSHTCLLKLMLFYFLTSRNCGNVFCSSCCNQKVPVPSQQLFEPSRVCKSCYSSLHPTSASIDIELDKPIAATSN